MFKRFYNGDDAIRNSVEFAKKVMSFGRNVSPAQIQGYFMMHKASTPAEVIENAGHIWDDSRKKELEKLNEKL